MLDNSYCLAYKQSYNASNTILATLSISFSIIFPAEWKALVYK